MSRPIAHGGWPPSWPATTASKTARLATPSSRGDGGDRLLAGLAGASRGATRAASVGVGRARGGSPSPGHDDVISPRTSPAAHPASSPSGPRTHLFVGLGEFAAHRGRGGRRRTPRPGRPASRPVGAAPRRTPSCAARRPARASSRGARRPCAAGSLRSRTGRRAARRPPARRAPPTVRAARSPRCRSATARPTSRYPGSDTDGIPASVTTSTSSPARSASSSSGTRRGSLASKNDTTRPTGSTPRSAHSRRNRRVSSAAITAAGERRRAAGPTRRRGCPSGRRGQHDPSGLRRARLSGHRSDRDARRRTHRGSAL